MMLIPDPDWADAETYRAHVTDLLASSGLHWRVLAAHAGISPRAMQSLLTGRRGRPVRRIHVTIAQALNATSEESLADAECTLIDKSPTVRLLTALDLLGHNPDRLPWLTGDDLAILHRRSYYCTVGTAARVLAAYDLLTTPVPAVSSAA